MNILIESYRAGLFQKQNWLRNLIAGLIVGVVALPLAMAFAIASGAKPEQGIYTAIVAGLVVSVFGGSRVQIAGPTGAFIVVLVSINNQYGMDGLQIATLLAGIMLFFFGIARLGAVIKFIPDPVILGFTAGIAVVIFVGQWEYFFGLPSPTGTHFYDKAYQLIQALPTFNLPTTLIGIASLCIVLSANKIPGINRIPGPLLALTFATILQSYFGFVDVATIGSKFGGIPLGLPSFHFPTLTVNRVLELIGPAFTIAMLGAIESLLSAVVADGMSNTRHHSNRELMGQGLANILSPLFGGFAATGAIARTATNIRNGGNSPLAGIMHALTLILVLLFLAPLATNVPLSCLAAILFVVAYNMSEIKHFVNMLKKAPKADCLILLVTFSLTIFVDLVVAVNIGIILAMLHFLLRMAASVEVQQQTDAHRLDEGAETTQKLPDDVLVYVIEGPFFFGAVEHFEQALKSTHTEPRVLILRFGWVPFIDGTGLNTLDEVIIDLHQKNVRVMLVGANSLVLDKLKKAGILARLEPHNVYKKFSSAVKALEDKPS